MLAAIVALLVGASSPAEAAALTVITGRIRVINQFANTATLDDGDTFALASGIDANNLHVGQMVKVTYRGIGSSKMALSVQPLN